MTQCHTLLAIIGVSDNGLMSFSIVTGGCFFDKGITVAVFHSFGSIPSLRELLNIAVTGAARRCEHSVNVHGRILSSPVALFSLM